MAQKRLYFAVQAAAVSAIGENTFTNIHGLQSVGINTRFNLEQVFEIGQLEIYENIENIPDIEVTTEKVLDGYPLVYHLATKGSSAATLGGRSNTRCILGLSVYTDTQDSASGTPLAQCTMSGLYVSAVDYNLNVQGNFTESVTLVGNNKVWNNSFTPTDFDNTDSPMAITGSGGVNRREDLILGEHSGALTRIPQDIPGVSNSGYVPYNTVTGEYAVHMQSIRVQSNFGREQLFELGRKGPYHRYITFPVEVRTDIEVLSTQGDGVAALEDSDNLTDRTIYLECREGTKIDLGSKNKLSSVTYGGANAGQQGGNATATYSYLNFNSLTVTHPQDPTPGLAA